MFYKNQNFLVFNNKKDDHYIDYVMISKNSLKVYYKHLKEDNIFYFICLYYKIFDDYENINKIYKNNNLFMLSDDKNTLYNYISILKIDTSKIRFKTVIYKYTLIYAQLMYPMHHSIECYIVLDTFLNDHSLELEILNVIYDILIENKSYIPFSNYLNDDEFYINYKAFSKKCLTKKYLIFNLNV